VTGERAALLDGVGLLERAIGYTLGALGPVTRAALSAPTPCAAWTLRDLLAHLDESLLALHEATTGQVALAPAGCAAADPVAAVRERAGCLLGAWARTTRTTTTVGDEDLTTAVVAAAGAFEVAVHGWDVAQSAGDGRPLPAGLAEEMLALSPFLVAAADRPVRFAEPVAVRAGAPAGDRLLAFLGRRP
jgi:uncharacterized protein (TIGR03086 family)